MRDAWLAFGVLLRVGFFGLLGPIELVSLRRCDLALPLGCFSRICGPTGDLNQETEDGKTLR